MQDGIPNDFSVFTLGKDTGAASSIKPRVEASTKLAPIFLRIRLAPWFRMESQPFFALLFPLREPVLRKRIHKSKCHKDARLALVPVRKIVTCFILKIAVEVNSASARQLRLAG